MEQKQSLQFKFQSTFPRGERPDLKQSNSTYTDFNPRSRVGNDELNRIESATLQIFQSTFPRGERHNRIKNNLTYLYISIHVPAWGTTLSGQGLVTYITHFNPRSRVGNDIMDRINSFGNYISIHVPAWGTTRYLKLIRRNVPISIHVPAWGTTAWAVRKRGKNEIFQSTFPRGERQCSVYKGFKVLSFQSTFPRGERQ